MEKDNSKKQKTFSGTVVSNKMKDTVVVSVERYEKHSRYGKYVKQRKKFKAHDAGNKKVLDERVQIVESRPISKDKHFIVI